MINKAITQVLDHPSRTFPPNTNQHSTQNPKKHPPTHEKSPI